MTPDPALASTVHANELPALRLSIVKLLQDVETERVELEAKGWTVEEAERGMTYLLSKLEEVRR